MNVHYIHWFNGTKSIDLGKVLNVLKKNKVKFTQFES